MTLFKAYNLPVHDFYLFFEKVELVLSWISSSGTTRVSLDEHFFKFETWNMSCTLLNSWGSWSRYATRPILSRISKRPIYRGFSFPFFPKRIIPFHGETFNMNLSPTCLGRVLCGRFFISPWLHRLGDYQKGFPRLSSSFTQANPKFIGMMPSLSTKLVFLGASCKKFKQVVNCYYGDFYSISVSQTLGNPSKLFWGCLNFKVNCNLS